MAYERRQSKPLDDDTLLLFKNDDQRDNQDPGYKGHGRAGGRDVWVSAWVNESKKDGRKYFKIKLKPKQEQRRETYTRQQEEDRRDGNIFDPEVPF